jgi:hypothetical protein
VCEVSKGVRKEGTLQKRDPNQATSLFSTSVSEDALQFSLSSSPYVPADLMGNILPSGRFNFLGKPFQSFPTKIPYGFTTKRLMTRQDSGSVFYILNLDPSD